MANSAVDQVSRFSRDLLIILVFVATPILTFMGYLTLGGGVGQSELCHPLQEPPRFGDIPMSGLNDFCTPSYWLVLRISKGWIEVGFAGFVAIYLLFFVWPLWRRKRAALRADATAGPPRSVVADQTSAAKRRFRFGRHLLIVVILPLLLSSAWVGSRLVAGDVGERQLCVSTVEAPQLGDVPMLNGSFCRPNWRATKDVWATATLILMTWIGLTYLIGFVVPAALHRRLTNDGLGFFEYVNYASVGSR